MVWMSSFLPPHQHTIGHSVPQKAKWELKSSKIKSSAWSASDISPAGLGGGTIVQLPCTGHPSPADWHRCWRVVWSCPGSTIAMLCCTALQATASSSYSVCRTTQLKWSSRRQASPLLSMLHWLPIQQRIEWVQSGSADVQSPQHVHAGVPS